jgi:cholesterol transport system auxiliary component
MTGELNLPPTLISLQIMQPQATPGLDSERIILRRDDNRIDYVSDAKWSGNLNSMMQSLLVESFDRSHALKAVGSDLVAMSHDYTLLIEIRDFQAEYLASNPVPRAHVRLTAKLIKADTATVVATRNYEEKEAATGDDLTSIVHAFDTATQNALQKVVSETIATLQAQTKTKAK